jgi:hypothetical protein
MYWIKKESVIKSYMYEKVSNLHLIIFDVSFFYKILSEVLKNENCITYY